MFHMQMVKLVRANFEYDLQAPKPSLVTNILKYSVVSVLTMGGHPNEDDRVIVIMMTGFICNLNDLFCRLVDIHMIYTILQKHWYLHLLMDLFLCCKCCVKH